jgi:hypothetical protein
MKKGAAVTVVGGTIAGCYEHTGNVEDAENILGTAEKEVPMRT